MNPIVQKTLGGLSKPYYFRQFAFGLVPFVLFIAMYFSAATSNETDFGLSTFAPIGILLVISTLLYPYSRFVYESIVGFVMGDNVFFVSTFSMMYVKCITIFLCWGFAILIAPIGLLYLYFHHSKQEKLHQQ